MLYTDQQNETGCVNLMPDHIVCKQIFTNINIVYIQYKLFPKRAVLFGYIWKILCSVTRMMVSQKSRMSFVS